MNTEYKKLWVNALRSDKYKQCRFTLENSDHENCCLGVLCRVLLGQNPNAFSVGRDPVEYAIIFDNDCSLLSPKILEQTGLTDDNQMILQKLNDKHFASFKEIASYIEKNY